MATRKTNGGYVSKEEFERQKEQLEGQRRGAALQGLQFDLEAEQSKTKAKGINAQAAAELVPQANSQLQIAKNKTEMLKSRVEFSNKELEGTREENRLKGELWELKVNNLKAAVEAAKTAGGSGTIPALGPEVIDVDPLDIY